MASVNRVHLIGRLTRSPECRVFANGGKVAKFGFAVEAGRKKNQDTGKWESEPCFLDVEAFDRGEHGKTASLVEQYLDKGQQCYVEGFLKMDTWTDKSGVKRNKIVVVADRVQFLERREHSEANGPRGEDPFASRPTKSVGQQYREKCLDESEVPENFAPDGTHNREDIPF